ncbi:hypothetical protein F7725_004334 [Dissostichus mawsoni]|uniref:Ig-like domain-containing protein n=1 Tax=Dissostichus mawsoni TaxID=36200 RepID=A0A7J5XIR6_DISMA|nr:hypothetical protein F7725_004334 [Dissostichus mawsoni]
MLGPTSVLLPHVDILFGNGTKLEFEDEVDSLVYFLSGSLAINFILVVLLAFIINKMKKINNKNKDQLVYILCYQGYQRAEKIYYGALGVSLTNRSGRQREPTWSECVYYSLRSISQHLRSSSQGTLCLNCTVHTGSCDGKHSVYWFKNSEDSPGLIYTHGGNNDQCERKPNTKTHSCVYNLPMENLNPSHAGTYFCAVASCGHILFGNGTKLDFEGKQITQLFNEK